MTCTIHCTHKKTGVVYVYESVSYWDKEKKQARNKRVCIGKLDPSSGTLIPSKRLTHQPSAPSTPDTASAVVVGPSLILDALSDKLGLTSLLKACFPRDHSSIQAMAYYLAIQGGPLSHCERWSKSQAPSLTASLASQRISEVLCSITTNEKQSFFKKWMKKVLEHDYVCYDITSISSYSELHEYIKYGYNRDREQLPQLNLGMIFGQKSGLPVYFERLPGNITDVTTVTNLLKSCKAMGIESLRYVLDRGFYSKKNIDHLPTSRSLPSLCPFITSGFSV